VLDGILAMEGQGPGKSGTPRQLGIIAGSHDTVALDIVVCKMLGISPDKLFTNKIAREQGLTAGPITIDGEFFEVKDFRLPEITPLIFGPQRLHGFMRRHLVQRPVLNDSLCEMCGECWRYCPAEAITGDGRKLHFDYDICIRCYCCIEVCPHGALRTGETATGRIARNLLLRHNK
jgi:ferredoxin